MLQDSLVKLPQDEFVFLVPVLGQALILLILLLDHTLFLLIRLLPILLGQLLINTLLCEFFLT